MSSKILVTGGNGFIGKKLVKAFNAETYDLPSSIFDYEKLELAVRGKDIVWHVAAVADLNWAIKNEERTFDVNVRGTENVARACAKNNVKLVYVSTCCVYGNQTTHPTTEESLPNPAELYAYTKLMGEHSIQAFGKMYGLEYNIARIATIYGEGMRDALAVRLFFEQAMKGELIAIHGNGEQTRQQTYIDDIIEGLLLLNNWKGSGEIFNFCSGEKISALKMAGLIKNIVGSQSEIKHIEQRKCQVFKEYVSSQKAKEILGWEAKTSFIDGLNKTYTWLKS